MGRAVVTGRVGQIGWLRWTSLRQGHLIENANEPAMRKSGRVAFQTKTRANDVASLSHSDDTKCTDSTELPCVPIRNHIYIFSLWDLRHLVLISVSSRCFNRGSIRKSGL